MASTTPNIGLTLPTGAEKVSRQIINDNNTIIDGKIGAVPGGQNLQGEIDALNSNLTPTPVTLSAGTGLAAGLSDCVAIQVGKIIFVTAICDSTGHAQWTDYQLLLLPSGMKFVKTCYAISQSNNGETALIQGYYNTNQIVLRPLGATLTSNDCRFTLIGALQ